MERNLRSPMVFVMGASCNLEGLLRRSILLLWVMASLNGLTVSLPWVLDHG